MRCIAVHCWRSTVGLSRWCRKHTDLILDNPPESGLWPLSRAEHRNRLRARLTNPTTQGETT